MGKPLRDASGRFAGSTGTGRRAPKAADTRTAVSAAPPVPPADSPAVPDAFTARLDRMLAKMRDRAGREPDIQPGAPLVHTRHGQVPVSNREITADMEMAYSSGQCFALADVLTRANPGSRVGLLIAKAPAGTTWGDDLPDDDATRAWVRAEVRHAVCVTADGHVLDIEGRWPLEAYQAECDAVDRPVLLLTTADRLRDEIVPNVAGGYPQDYDAAKSVVPLIAH